MVYYTHRLDSIPGASTLNPASRLGFSLRCTKGAGNVTLGVHAKLAKVGATCLVHLVHAATSVCVRFRKSGMGDTEAQCVGSRPALVAASVTTFVVGRGPASDSPLDRDERRESVLRVELDRPRLRVHYDARSADLVRHLD